MAKEKKQRKPWTKKRKIKLGIWLAVILAVALGFFHQYYIHTDGYIKSYIEKNKTELSAAAEVLLETPTTSDTFKQSLTDENRITGENKYNIKTVASNPCYKDNRETLEAVSGAGIQDVKSDGTTVRFYHSSRYVVIYSPDKAEITGAESAGDGWFYLKSF